MKRYERKAEQATKKERGVGASRDPARDPAWVGKPILHSKAAKAGWLARYKAEAIKLEAKRRPSRKDQERLQKLHDDIARLTPRKSVRKAPARKQAPISQNQPTRKKAAKKRAVKTPARKVPVRKIPVRKVPVRKVPVRKIPVRKTPVRKQPQKPARKQPRKRKPKVKDWRTLTGAEFAKAFLEMSKRQREEQAAQRILLYNEYTQDPDQMKARLLELRDDAIMRGEVEFPRVPFDQPILKDTRVDRGEKIHINGQLFLTDPGAVLEVMVNAARAANKLTVKPGATWIATISMLVYGQKTFGSPPSPWTGTSADASLFQVQSFESTGAQPTKIGMLDALQSKLDDASEISNSVVWLEFLTIQQFTPFDTEEKKRWRREQARKKREAAKRKQARKPRKPRKKKPITRKKKRVPSGRKSSLSPKRPSKPKKASVKPKKKSSQPSRPKAKKAPARTVKKTVKKAVKKKVVRKSSTSSRSKVR